MSVEDNSVIARTGKWAMFAALRECCPSAIRSDDPFIGRHGLTEIELNKVLERSGFVKVRDRSGASPLIVEGREETIEKDAKGYKGEWMYLARCVQSAIPGDTGCAHCICAGGFCLRPPP